MAYTQLAQITARCDETGKAFWQIVQESDCQERDVTPAQSFADMQRMYRAMEQADAAYDPSLRSASGMVGGDGEKMRAVRTAVAFYDRLRPVLKNGRTLVNENRGVTSLRRLKGARWLIRFSADGTEAVLWAFSFDRQPVFAVEEPSLAAYRMEDAFVDGAAELEGETLKIRPNAPDSALGAVFYLRRR